MRLRVLIMRLGITGTLLLGSAFCGGWKWSPHP